MGLTSQSLSQTQAGEEGWELQEGERRGRKVETVELDLKWLQRDWEQ